MTEATQATLIAVGISPLGDNADTILIRSKLDAAATRRLVEVLNGDARGRSALIMCPTWCDASSMRRLRLACTAAQHGRVAVYSTTLPPLGARVLMWQARDLLDYAPAGWVHAVLGALERRYTACAVLSHIRGLARPNPRFGQHVMSMVPGTGFIASTHPAPSVRRMRPGQPLDLAEPPAPSGAVIAEAAGGAERMRDTLLRALGSDVGQAEPDAGGAEFWGTSRYTEIVRYPTLTSDRLTELQAAIPARRCGWCGGWTGASPCPYCAMVLDATGRGRAPASRRAGTTGRVA
jgi:hypothetical protein